MGAASVAVGMEPQASQDGEDLSAPHRVVPGKSRQPEKLMKAKRSRPQPPAAMLQLTRVGEGRGEEGSQ